jgi:DNA polymerase III sliding clamp (beta) subunit (PCNA family)
VKVTVRINEFKRVLDETRVVVKGKPALAVLAYVKLEVNDANRATLTAADLTNSIVQSFEVVDGEPGSLLLPAKKTYQFLKGIIAGTATIETTADERTIIKAGTFKISVPSVDVRQFPDPEAMPQAEHAINLKLLRKLVTQVEGAAPDKGGSVTIPVVQVEGTTERLRAVATQGFAIAFADQKVVGGAEFTIVLPKAFVPLIKRRAGTTVHFAESATNYFFRTDSVMLQCRKYPGKFPRYQKAVEDPTFKGSVRLARSDLKSTITTILGGHNPDNPRTTFVIHGNTLTLTGNGLDTATGSITVFSEGEPDITTYLNSEFVLEFLAQAASDDVTIRLGSRNGFVEFNDDDGLRYLIMPMLPDSEAREKKVLKR